MKVAAAVHALALLVSLAAAAAAALPARVQAQPASDRPAPAGQSDSPARAQPAQPGTPLPPTGPAQIIRRAGRARDARELQQAAERGQPSTPPPAPAAPGAPGGSADAAPASPIAGDPHGAAGAAGPHAGMGEREPQPIATERADRSLPIGTIRVHVRAPDGQPARGAEVALGIMSSDSSRATKTARTDGDGTALFSGLATGDRQAYRVNVPYRGAKYSSTPFRLPADSGYRVEVRQLPVTRDERLIVLYVGATSIELKDERVHIVQQARLLNLGGATYVFPEGGARVRLPAGFTAFQVQESMTDQRIVEDKGAGMRVEGSLPPGEATLLWGFDLPLEGTEMRIALDIPWLTFAYRVIADAPEGLRLDVEGMPEPMLHTDAGRRFLVTEMQRKVGDPPFQRLEFALHGIPGPGPGRWIAAALALIAIGGGIALSRRSASRPRTRAHDRALTARQDELLARARELAAMQRAGETGPQYHAEQMALLTDELAALLFEEAEQNRARTAAPTTQ